MGVFPSVHAQGSPLVDPSELVSVIKYPLLNSKSMWQHALLSETPHHHKGKHSRGVPEETQSGQHSAAWNSRRTRESQLTLGYQATSQWHYTMLWVTRWHPSGTTLCSGWPGDIPVALHYALVLKDGQVLGMQSSEEAAALWLSSSKHRKWTPTSLHFCFR